MPLNILHVVTLVSPNASFGGPLRVALNQAAELRARGHAVTLAAGWRGDGLIPQKIENTRVHLFPTHSPIPRLGFSGLVSPRFATWLARNIKQYDIVHIHAGRDLISTTAMTIAMLSHQPYVTQTHGMVAPDVRLRAWLLDALFTRHLLRRAKYRFVLTQTEARDLCAIIGHQFPLKRLINGVPEVRQRPFRARGRQVLFCARLQKRKRPVAFVEIAAELNRRGVAADYAIVGADEGELESVERAVRRHGLEGAVHYEGALSYDKVLDRMADADVYVLPSVNEPFPMSLLEALSLGVPSLCCDSCGVADILRDNAAAIVSDCTTIAMADAVEAMLGDAKLAEDLSANAKRTVTEIFSMVSVGDLLEASYLAVCQFSRERS